MKIDLNDWPDQAARKCTANDDFLDQEVAAAWLRDHVDQWVIELFPAGKYDDDRNWRVADISGRAPRKQGSCVISMHGDKAGSYCDFDGGANGGPIKTVGDRLGLVRGDLFAEIKRMMGKSATSLAATAPAVAAKEKDYSTEIAWALKDAGPLRGTIGETYLRERGITEIPNSADVLFTPDLTHYAHKAGYPGIVMRLSTPEGVYGGNIHRAYLERDGSGRIERKLLGARLPGDVIRIDPINEAGEIGVGEGLESALAARQQFGVPMWAAGDAGGMCKLGDWLREHGAGPIKRMPIFADRGETGEGAAQHLANCAMSVGIEAVIRLPASPDDFNTDLMEGLPPSNIILPIETVPIAAPRGKISLDDFYAYMPMHNYIFAPTGTTWPAASVNSRLPPVAVPGKDGEKVFIPAAAWLDKNKPVEQMTWAPGFLDFIVDRLILEGGWVDRPGFACFNLYRAPSIEPGDPTKADKWVDHVRAIYPHAADHIINWLAQRVQRPQEKTNHALVLGGDQGIGKDTLLAPVQYAVGAWNFQEASPDQILGRFNPFLKSVILRISEARDLGDFDRFKFYDHTKTLTASPPETLTVDDKNMRLYSIINCVGIIITTNYRHDAIYLPADDRRHYVAWSESKRTDFTETYWKKLWRWYETGGFQHVAAFLRQHDLSGFNPKAPPPQTEAWWAIVGHNNPSEERELADLLDYIGVVDTKEADKPADQQSRTADNSTAAQPPAVPLGRLQTAALAKGEPAFSEWLKDRKNRRVIPHRMEKCGYIPVRNSDATDGLWVIEGRRQVVYARKELSVDERRKAAKALQPQTATPNR